MRTLCRKSFAIGLLVAFLVVSTGRAVPVKAVGTTVAATAAAAFLATGVIYMSYLALTGAQVTLPAVSDLGSYLTDVGRKVAEYPSGAATYSELYERYHIFRSPIGNFIDGVWSWTQDKLQAFANDFSTTSVIENIVGYYEYVDITYTPTNGFTYSNYSILNETVDGTSFGTLVSQGYTIIPYGSIICVNRSDYNGQVIHYPAFSNLTGEWRNLLKTNGKYCIQQYVNGSWVTDTPYHLLGYSMTATNYVRQLAPFPASLQYHRQSETASRVLAEYDFPYLLNRVIHVQATDEDLPMVIPESEVFHAPQWTDPDNDYRPIIPYVPIPKLPANIPTPSGYTGIDQWGFNIEDLVDLLGDLGESIFDLLALKELLNDFAGLHGDNYYLEYNDGDTNYYVLYQPNNYNGDYVTYNIDVSEVSEKLPVDLNTIQNYTNNRYIEAFKEHAVAGGSIIRDLVVFWYDVDPEIVYVVFGTCILTLIAAFIGKWGHS